MTLKGLSSACAKLEPASSENNEIRQINVLQKFTPHALYDFGFDFRKISVRNVINAMVIWKRLY